MSEPHGELPHKNRVPQVSILRPGISSRLLGPALILLAAAVATVPILLHGPFCGDDFEFHVVSWLDVQKNWLHGVPYPHWAPSVNYGAGEPRFLFYPPFTWMLGAALGFVLPWPLVSVAMVFLFLAGTGLATRALALQALRDAPATLAGCAALFSGFALFTAYKRTAFAELSGGFWIPLVLLFALRDRNPSAGLWRRALDGSTLPLALLMAGCWLSDGPVGVMASYLLVAIAVAVCVLARSWAHLLRAAIAAALGIALPAFYLIPAAWEQTWVDLRAAVDYPVFRIENNWLFARHTDPLLAPFDAMVYRTSMLATSMTAVALLSLMVLFLRRRSFARRPAAAHVHPLARAWWIPLALIPFAVLFLQFPVSLPVWNLLPKLRFLQYPWRCLLVLEAPMAIFFAAAVWPQPQAGRWRRAAVPALCALSFLAATCFSARAFLRICGEGDSTQDLLAMYRGGGGLEGTDEYEPPESDHWKIATGLPDACFTADSGATLGIVAPGEAIPNWQPAQGSCEATPAAQLHTPEHLRVSTVAAHPGFLILRLVGYPAWRITVNGQPTDPADPRDDGLLAVPVPQGSVDLRVDWSTTLDVVAGRCLSGLALVLLAALGLCERKRPTPRASRDSGHPRLGREASGMMG
jgi:hypothetical protein